MPTTSLYNQLNAPYPYVSDNPELTTVSVTKGVGVQLRGGEGAEVEAALVKVRDEAGLNKLERISR